MRRFNRSIGLLILSAILTPAANALAQSTQPTTLPAAIDSGQIDATGTGSTVITLDPTQPPPDPKIAKPAGKNGEFVIAPIPKFDPSQEFSLTVMGMYLFHQDPTDQDTPPSVIALGGMYTQEDSAVLVGAYMGYLDHDLWRVAAFGGVGRFNYDYYGNGNAAADHDVSLPIQQNFEALGGNVLRQVSAISPHLYIGPRLQVSNMDVHVNTKETPFPLPKSDSSFWNNAVGLRLQYDTRDSTMYPTTGKLFELDGDFYTAAIGGDFDFQAYKAAYNQYFPVNDDSVLAVRAYGKATEGNVPFFGLAQFGTQSDLRGYESGKYRDRDMFDVQAEYRYLLNKWIGLAAFAGVGEVFDGVHTINSQDLLYSIGGGVRFRLAKENPVFYRVDCAYGKDGFTCYLGVGQAF